MNKSEQYPKRFSKSDREYAISDIKERAKKSARELLSEEDRAALDNPDISARTKLSLATVPGLASSLRENPAISAYLAADRKLDDLVIKERERMYQEEIGIHDDAAEKLDAAHAEALTENKARNQEARTRKLEENATKAGMTVEDYRKHLRAEDEKRRSEAQNNIEQM